MNGKTILHLLMVVSLFLTLSLPPAVAAGLTPKSAHSCCGLTCQCPPSLACGMATTPASDRETPERVAQASTTRVDLTHISFVLPAPKFASAIPFAIRTFVPTPLLSGSPPQAILRLWQV